MILLSFDTEEFDVPREHGVDISLEEGMRVSMAGTTRILDILKANSSTARLWLPTAPHVRRFRPRYSGRRLSIQFIFEPSLYSWALHAPANAAHMVYESWRHADTCERQSPPAHSAFLAGFA